jgi:hypothetical protein
MDEGVFDDVTNAEPVVLPPHEHGLLQHWSGRKRLRARNDAPILDLAHNFGDLGHLAPKSKANRHRD